MVTGGRLPGAHAGGCPLGTVRSLSCILDEELMLGGVDGGNFWLEELGPKRQLDTS